MGRKGKGKGTPFAINMTAHEVPTSQSDENEEHSKNILFDLRHGGLQGDPHGEK